MRKTYGSPEKAKQVFYAMVEEGKLTAVERPRKKRAKKNEARVSSRRN